MSVIRRMVGNHSVPPRKGGTKNPLIVFEGFFSLTPAGGVSGYEWLCEEFVDYKRRKCYV